MSKRAEAIAEKDGRERILAVAIRSFSELGYEGTTTAGVARDAEVTDFQGLLDLAKTARAAKQYDRAESAIRRAQALEPGSQAVLAVLASILRHRSAPERAIANGCVRAAVYVALERP